MTLNTSEKAILAQLESGVKRTVGFMAKLTDYHGDAVSTEYLLTADIARALLCGGYEVKVECLYWRLINNMTLLGGANLTSCRATLGSKRMDIGIIESEVTPRAIIEVKIGARTLGRVKQDLSKITTAIGMMNAASAARVVGAAVFQVHLRATRNRDNAARFRAAVQQLESSFHSDLRKYASRTSDFNFTLCPLQETHAGITDQEITLFEDHLEAGRTGHAVRYYAIIIRSTRAVPANTFANLKHKQRT